MSEKQNFFSKIFNSIENSYYKFSDWITKKGINLNALNEKLEDKGIPPVAVVGSILLIILFLIIFLLISVFSPKVSLEFSVLDYENYSVDNSYLTIMDSKENTIFSGNINNKDVITEKKIKIGKTYSLSVKKDGYLDFKDEITILSKKQTVLVSFDEVLEFGTLELTIIDSENKKIIPNSIANLTYSANGEEVEETQNALEENAYKIIMQVPLNKKMDLLVKADNYQDFILRNFESLEEFESKSVELVVNDEIFLAGKSDLVFIVNDTLGNLVNDAVVDVYNLEENLIGTEITVDGKALIKVNSGETITFNVSKKGYRTNVSDPETSWRILEKEKIIPITLETGGTSISLNILDLDNYTPVENTKVNIYDSNNILIDSNVTDFSGQLMFSGLENDSNIVVSACSDSYLCTVEKISLKEYNKKDVLLEKIKIDNSSLLNVFVVDSKNLPVDTAIIKIFEVSDQETYAYSENFTVDSTGSLSIPLKNGKEFLVEAYVGDLKDYDFVTISDYQENKIIFVMDKADKLIDLELLGKDGNQVSNGHLTIRTKDGTVLFDDDLNEGRVFFNSAGYNDFFADYYDENSNLTTIPFSQNELDEDGYISLQLIDPEQVNEGNYPIMEFVGIKDYRGNEVNYISEGQDYYLIFDVLFPKGAKTGGVHIRAGDDLLVDSEDMSFGITGFVSDSTDFRYSTTYNPLPEPGNQAIDFLNEGTSGQINKWVELYWNQSLDIGNKQIKVKVKAINTDKLKADFKYRAWSEMDQGYFRDPVDSTLLDKKSISTKQSLYAETKDLEIDVFDIPLNCEDDVCVSYKIISENGDEFTTDNFVALKDEVYALETTFFSFKNATVNLETETSNTKPIISFVSSGETFSYPTNINLETVSQLNLTQGNINLTAGTRKKIYTFFVAKNIGVSYIDAKVYSDSFEDMKQRINFDIYQKRNMNVLFTPDYLASYGSQIKLEVYDSTNGNPIENAFIKIEDEYEQFITSFEGNNLNGKKGVYTIDVDFVVNKINVTVSAYGYKPYSREILIADNGILSGPDEILINMGTSQLSEVSSFTIENLSDTAVTNVRFGETIWVEQADDLTIDLRGPITILKNTPTKFEVIATASKDSQFTSAIARVPIYGLVGNRQVAKLVQFRVVRGLLVDDCLVIKPEQIDTYVGINNEYDQSDYFSTEYNDYYNQNYTESIYDPYNGGQDTRYYDQTYDTTNNLNYYNDGFNKYYSSLFRNTNGTSQNTVGFTIYNSCEKAVTLNPELVLDKQNSNNDLDIMLTDVTVLPGEETLYNIIIENNTDRTQAKEYSYDILWNNSYYSLSPTKLNVKLLDLSNALWATPQIITVPLTQLTSQQQAITSTRFWIKNIGNVPISNIQLSRYPERVSANIGVTEYPREVEILEAGKMVPIDLKFQVSMKKATFDDMYFVVKGTAAGVRDPIVSYIRVAFLISSPNCLKISPQKLSYNINLGERKNRTVTITNQCAEPVSVIGLDKSGYGYLEAFGSNLVSLYPIYGSQTIPVNGESQFSLDVTALDYKQSPSLPLTIVGRTSSGGYVTSESILTSISITSEDQEDRMDLEQTKDIEVPVCSNPSEVELVTFPIISSSKDCSTTGYCDASSVSKLILSKISELYSEIAQVSAHSQNLLTNTSCSRTDAAKGFCSISDLGSTLEPIEFTFYMQNDYVSDDLLYSELKNTNYKFNKYMVDPNPYDTLPEVVYGLYSSGNRIYLTNGLKGCGRYTVEINAYVAADNEYIYPDRIYFYVNLVDSKYTDQCTKRISNFLNFLPWDSDLMNKYNYGTWLTVFSGDQNISEGVIDSLNNFKDTDNRYVKNTSATLKNNVLHSSVSKIVENDEALAKISFYDYSEDLAKAEQVNFVVNDRYSTSSSGNLPEKVVKDSVKIISKVLSKEDFAKLCITEDRKSLLVLELIEAGELKFIKEEYTLPINTQETCQDINITSGIEESVSVSLNAPDGLLVYFKDSSNNISENTVVDLKVNNPSTVKVCFKPEQDDVYNYVGKDITVIANSIFRQTGEMSLREAKSIIHLSSCGVTPLKVLEEVASVIDSYDRQDKTISNLELYALVDWQKSYSNLDAENICETIRKYNLNNPEAIGFYEYASIDCDLDITESQEKARKEKYADNATKYFTGCMATCSACSVGSDLLISWIPVLGQAKILKDVLLDCGVFACGIPSVGILLNGYTSEGLDVAIDKFIGDVLPGVFGDEPRIAQGVSEIARNAGSFISGAFAGTRLVKTAPLSTSNPQMINQRFNTVTVAPTPAPTPVPAPVAPTPTGNYNPKIPTIGKTSQASDLFESLVTGNTVNNYKINPATLNASGLTTAEIDDMKNILRGGLVGQNSNRMYSYSFDTLTQSQLDDYAEALSKYKRLLGTPGVAADNLGNGINPTTAKSYLSKKFKDVDGFKNFKFGGAAPTPPAPNPTNGTTGTTGTGTTGTTIYTKELSNANYNYTLDEFNKLEKQYTSSIKEIDERLAKLESKGKLKKIRQAPSNKEIARLTNEKKALEAAKSKLADSKKILEKGVKETLSDGSVVYRYTDDVATELTNGLNSINSSGPKIRAPSTKKAKFWSGFAGIVRGLGCGLLGNHFGARNVSESGAVLLNDAISIIEPVEFSKNMFYEIVIENNNVDDTHGRYILTISPSTQVLVDKDKRIDSCVSNTLNLGQTNSTILPVNNSQTNQTNTQNPNNSNNLLNQAN